LSFIYRIYNNNWKYINTIYIYIYITRLESNEIFSPSNKLHREVGRAKDLSVPLYSFMVCNWYVAPETCRPGSHSCDPSSVPR